ncbi:MAG: alpha/beta fold hydrolase [Candidatus Dormibacteria bacterium]
MTDMPGGIRIEANGLNFNVVDAGVGPAVLLLHGFPDSCHLWRHQLPALVAAGFRVVAPDLRGFGESDKPQEVEAYAMGEILDDLRAILRTLGIPKVHVVGHDFGAAVAWMFTVVAPGKVDRLVAVSVGHPVNFLRPTIKQMQMSWYTYLFQFPGIAEALIPRDDWAFLKAWSSGTGDLDRYQHDLARPGALTAALNWYRASFNPRRLIEDNPAFPRVERPVMGIWGAHDRALTEESMTDSASQVSGPWRYERIDDAGHWIPLEQPDRLNDLLIEFFRSDAPARAPQTDVREAVGRRDSALADRLQGLHFDTAPD